MNKPLKKVLFISYYWPPAGGAPINRILKFYKFLPEYGWEPVILTVDKGDFPFIDESLSAELRSDSKIFKAKNFKFPKFLTSGGKGEKKFVPYGFTDSTKKSLKNRLSRWLKFNAVPDTRILWRFKAVKMAIQIIKDENIDVIFSSSPPQTNHIIAAQAAKRTGIPWIADFRDPWSDVFWLKSQNIRLGCLQRLDRRIERKTISRMNEIITVSPTWVKLFENKSNKSVHLIYNGYDEDFFAPEKMRNDNKFVITYAGSMSYEQRPYAFFEALKRLKHNPQFIQNLEVRFVGNFPDFLNTMTMESGLASNIVHFPFKNMKDAIADMQNSDLLLIIVPDNNDFGVIPSKLYDYLAARKPVLGYGHPQCDTAKIIQKTSSGKLFASDDAVQSSAFIEEIYNMTIKKELYISPENNVDEFSRRNLTKSLAKIFDHVWNSRNN
jgi:glycosyltransferase involved in cell wall biosynthesis